MKTNRALPLRLAEFFAGTVLALAVLDATLARSTDHAWVVLAAFAALLVSLCYLRARATPPGPLAAALVFPALCWAAFVAYGMALDSLSGILTMDARVGGIPIHLYLESLGCAFGTTLLIGPFVALCAPTKTRAGAVAVFGPTALALAWPVMSSKGSPAVHLVSGIDAAVLLAAGVLGATLLARFLNRCLPLEGRPATS